MNFHTIFTQPLCYSSQLRLGTRLVIATAPLTGVGALECFRFVQFNTLIDPLTAIIWCKILQEKECKHRLIWSGSASKYLRNRCCSHSISLYLCKKNMHTKLGALVHTWIKTSTSGLVNAVLKATKECGLCLPLQDSRKNEIKMKSVICGTFSRPSIQQLLFLARDTCCSQQGSLSAMTLQFWQQRG